MKLHLIDISPDIVAAWEAAFQDFSDVRIECGNIMELAHNTIVSPANSYGYMDGGIDLVYRNFFGYEIEHIVQGEIEQRQEKHLPIGEAILVETGHERITHMISAPTMFIPEPIPARNCGLAMEAILQTAYENSDVVSDIFCPGLGTGIGRVSVEDAADEMARVYRGWIEAN